MGCRMGSLWLAVAVPAYGVLLVLRFRIVGLGWVGMGFGREETCEKGCAEVVEG
jgi:hypothetical protein